MRNIYKIFFSEEGKIENAFKAATQSNAEVGGDNASRSIAIGMVLGELCFPKMLFLTTMKYFYTSILHIHIFTVSLFHWTTLFSIFFWKHTELDDERNNNNNNNSHFLVDEEEEAEIAMLRWSDDEFEYDDAIYENQGEIGLLSLEGGGSGGGRGNLSLEG